VFGPIRIAGASWEPVYAAPILTVVGVNALIFGAVARVATTQRGLTVEDRTLRAARRLLTFEFSIAGGIGLAVAGIVLDATIAFGPANHLSIAAIAETLILTGANVLLCGSLAAIVSGSN
jgi:hypothetical protein